MDGSTCVVVDPVISVVVEKWVEASDVYPVRTKLELDHVATIQNLDRSNRHRF